MKIVRTIGWALLFIVLLAFSIANWHPPVVVKIWENLVVETKIPVIVVLSILIGLVPMWLIHRASKWQLKRRIASLESAVRAVAAARDDQPIAPVLLTDPVVTDPLVPSGNEPVASTVPAPPAPEAAASTPADTPGKSQGAAAVDKFGPASS